jgi:hypothetical protein
MGRLSLFAAVSAALVLAAGTAAKTPARLQPEPAATAAGDIPDNQVFIRYRNAQGGYSMEYPEGWAQRGTGASVTFRDKNNVVRVLVEKGVHAAKDAQPVTLPAGKAFKVVYRSVSVPNAVTGKRVTLTVDRYYVPHGSKEAVVDLGTPVGVDNVDAYRLIVQSFRWL